MRSTRADGDAFRREVVRTRRGRMPLNIEPGGILTGEGERRGIREIGSQLVSARAATVVCDLNYA